MYGGGRGAGGREEDKDKIHGAEKDCINKQGGQRGGTIRQKRRGGLNLHDNLKFNECGEGRGETQIPKNRNMSSSPPTSPPRASAE